MGKYFISEHILATDSWYESTKKVKEILKKKKIKSPKIGKWRFSPDKGRTIFIAKNKAHYLQLKKKYDIQD